MHPNLKLLDYFIFSGQTLSSQHHCLPSNVYLLSVTLSYLFSGVIVFRGSPSGTRAASENARGMPSAIPCSESYV